MQRTHKFLLTACFLLALFSASAQTGAIRGNLFDQVSKDPLPAANITLQHTSYHTRADEKGNFSMTNIQAGEYDILITNVGYTDIRKHIVVKTGETTKLYLGLTASGQALEEVTVFGRADREKETGARDRERSAANMMNVISAQAMVRSPDINAANVLQRMSGVTIQRSNGGDEAYAVIRGMEPRYSNTLLNGIKIASPDSKSRYVQLGIVPSDILSSIEVSKSLTPDMEGDATGGTVNMVVKDAPDKTSFKATASIGYSGLFFDEKYVGFHTGDIQDNSPQQRHPGVAATTSDFPKSNLDFWKRQSLPTTLAGFSFTHRYLRDKLGFVLAENLQNQYYGNISFQATAIPLNDTTGHLHQYDANNFQQYTQQLNNGLVTHLDYVLNEKNKINIDNFYLYSYLAQARIDADQILIGTGGIGGNTGQVFGNLTSQTQHLYVENLKLSGQHFVSPDLRLDWAGVYSSAGNRQPDVANINTVYLVHPDGSRTGTYFDGISRSWQHNDDKEYSGVLDLDYKKRFNGGELQIKAGGLYRYLSRYNIQDDYSLIAPSSIGSTDSAASKPLWTNIYSEQYTVYNPSGSSYNVNNYKADETIYAGYGAIRFKAALWEAGGGLRLEHTNDQWYVIQDTKHPEYYEGKLVNGGQIYQDFLPSAWFKYELAHRQYLHLSYYRSITRPNYYELVPTQGSPDVTTGQVTKGNDALLHSVADNLDIRYEWFPRGEEHLFIGAFYKYIQNPIELQLTGGGSGGLYAVEPLNSNPATNVGAEASFTKYWGRFGVSGNYTYTHSSISSLQVTPQGKHVTPTRPMQGQTDDVVNLSLLYKDTKHGAFVQLSYQYQGNTLAETGQYAGADYFQRPMNTLAVSGEKDIHKHFTVFAKLNNLLNTRVEQYVQDVLVLKNTYRATYSVGVRYTY